LFDPRKLQHHAECLREDIAKSRHFPPKKKGEENKLGICWLY